MDTVRVHDVTIGYQVVTDSFCYYARKEQQFSRHMQISSEQVVALFQYF